MISEIEDPRRRRLASAALWGAVGFMTVLAAAQGYALLLGLLLSIGEAAIIGLIVGAVVGVVVYATEHRVAEWAADWSSERPGRE